MVTGDGVTVLHHQMPTKHICKLLGWRYSRPLVPANISDSDDATTARATGRTVNKIVVVFSFNLTVGTTFSHSSTSSPAATWRNSGVICVFRVQGLYMRPHSVFSATHLLISSFLRP